MPIITVKIGAREFLDSTTFKKARSAILEAGYSKFDGFWDSVRAVDFMGEAFRYNPGPRDILFKKFDLGYLTPFEKRRKILHRSFSA